MSGKSRWEYLGTVFARYGMASNERKQVMLDELCADTGYNRKYAIRVLNGPEPVTSRRQRRRVIVRD